MNTKVLSLLFLTIITGLLSCKDKDLVPASSPTTPVNVINATTDTINFYVNGTRQNDLSNIYPSGAIGYLNIATGSQTYQVKKSRTGILLFDLPYKLDTSTYYSIFVAGETADKAFLTVDSLSAAGAKLDSDATSTTCMIRFVNAAPTVGSLNVNVGKGDTVNLTNCAFKYAGSFTQIKQGQKEVKIYLAGSSIPKIDTTLTLTAGSIYTLFTQGKTTGTGTGVFSVSLIIN
jgi:hypothetical protein